MTPGPKLSLARPYADRKPVAKDRGVHARGEPFGATLIEADDVDEPVGASERRLRLQCADCQILARIARQQEGRAPVVPPKMRHDFIWTRDGIAQLIDL